jgi:hypothetical protein
MQSLSDSPGLRARDIQIRRDISTGERFVVPDGWDDGRTEVEIRYEQPRRHGPHARLESTVGIVWIDKFTVPVEEAGDA